MQSERIYSVARLLHRHLPNRSSAKLPNVVKRVVADDKLEHDASHAPRVYEVAVVRVVHHNLAGRFGAHGEGAGDTRVSESSDLRW